MGYLFAEEHRGELVIRNCFIDPSGEYADTPWTGPNQFGYCIQPCNVENQFGAFSELEYHAPGIGHLSGRVACEDTSQVWSFRGNRERIGEVAARLLGTECRQSLPR